MSFSDAEKIRNRVIAQAFTADGFSTNTTFARQLDLIITGTFTARVQIQAKTEGTATLPGVWAVWKEFNAPTMESIVFNKDRPWRIEVLNFTAGTANVFLETLDNYLDE